MTVQLIDGPIVQVAALRSAIDLENRGVQLVINEGKLVAGNAALLTADDRVAVKKYYRHLLAIVDYKHEPPPA